MSVQRDDALDRAIGRFLNDQAEHIARRAASAEAVASVVAARGGGRSLARSRLVLALALLLLGALVIGFIGAMQRMRGGVVGPIPGNLAWSPNGSILAFSTLDVAQRPGAGSGTVERAVEIWVVKADGTGLHQIARDVDETTAFRSAATITWSPDGRFVAYDLPLHDTDYRFAVQEVDAPTRAEFGGLPVAWSPVDDRLLVQLDSPAGEDLALLPAAGGDLRHLTSTGDARFASWSPDGSAILYVSGSASGSQTPSSEMHVVSPDGLGTRALGVCCDLGWAPDGSAIYYSPDGEALRAIAPDGTGDRLIDSSIEWFGWSWQPHGSRYVTAGSHGLEVATPGGQATRLTDDEKDTDPSWSPDGSWISFRGDRETGAGGFVVPAAGGLPTLVAPNALRTSPLVWRPGTNQLAFVRGHAIEAVSADGSGRVVIVQPGMLGGRPDDQPPPGLPRIVVGPDGPDHDVYRVTAPSEFELIVENTTDELWRIDLEGFGIFSEDCRPVEASDLQLVAYRGPPGTPAMGLPTPPDFCALRPREVVRVVKPQQLGGAALIALTRTSTGVRYPVILEFGP